MNDPQLRRDARDIGARMGERRKELRLSQRAVAESVGVSVRTYQRWERGETVGVFTRLTPIASALDVPLMVLLAGEAETERLVRPLEERVASLERRLDDVIQTLARVIQLPVARRGKR